MKDVIKAFFSGLSEKERKIFYVTCVIVALAVFDRVIVGPITKETMVLKEKIDSQTKLIEKNLRILKYKDSILDKYVLYGKYFAKPSMTQEEKIAAYLNEIEEMAKKSNVALINVNPVSATEQNGYSLYTLTVDCTSTMNDFVDFIYTIDSSKKLIRTITYTIAPKDRETYEVKATLTIVKMIIFPFDQNFFS